MSLLSSWKLNAQFQTTRTLKNFWSKTQEKTLKGKTCLRNILLISQQKLEIQVQQNFPLISYRKPP